MNHLTLNSKMILVSWITFGFLSINNQPSMAQSKLCNLVEAFGKYSQSQILTEVSKKISGKSENINAGLIKKLQFNGVENISFNGCEITTTLNVTLQQKWPFSDDHGTIKLKTVIESFSLDNKSICYTDTTLTNISLNKTVRSFENFYKNEFNKRFHNSGNAKGCFNL